MLKWRAQSVDDDDDDDAFYLPLGGLDSKCGPVWLYVIVKRAQVYQTPFVLCTSLGARRFWLHNWTVIVKSVLVR